MNLQRVSDLVAFGRGEDDAAPQATTKVDATKGDWDEKLPEDEQSERQRKNSEMKEGFEEERVEKVGAGEEEGVSAVDMVPEARFTDVEEKENPLG